MLCNTGRKKRCSINVHVTGSDALHPYPSHETWHLFVPNEVMHAHSQDRTGVGVLCGYCSNISPKLLLVARNMNC